MAKREATARAISANARMAAGRDAIPRGMTRLRGNRFSRMYWANPRQRFEKN